MRRNRGVWFVSLATASSLLGDQMLYAVLPTIYADLGLQPFHVGILLSHFVTPTCTRSEVSSQCFLFFRIFL